MIITRSREHTVNLGNYENVKIGASVTLTDDDILNIRRIGADLEAEVNARLDNLLAEDLKEAAANVPQGQDTHLESWKQ